MNWDDLRIVLAVRDSGTYAGAAARLRIDETTVARRLARLQQDIGVALFNAVDGMREPTSHCTAILAHAQEIARHVERIGEVGRSTQGPAGRFRIATTSSIAEELLAPAAAELLAASPGLTLQFMTSSENVNFSRWEADIAIRLRKPERGDFTIAKLGDVRLCLVEPSRRRSRRGADLICAYPAELDPTPESQYLADKGLLGQARCITDNVRVLCSVVQSGGAVAILPRYMCASLAKDRRFIVTPLEQTREVWLLVQSHLKRDAAARVVIDWIRSCFAVLD